MHSNRSLLLVGLIALATGVAIGALAFSSRSSDSDGNDRIALEARQPAVDHASHEDRQPAPVLSHHPVPPEEAPAQETGLKLAGADFSDIPATLPVSQDVLADIKRPGGSGAIHGRVFDETGLSVEGIRILAIDTALSEKVRGVSYWDSDGYPKQDVPPTIGREVKNLITSILHIDGYPDAITDAQGSFRFEGLKAGSQYRISVASRGYSQVSTALATAVDPGEGLTNESLVELRIYRLVEVPIEVEGPPGIDVPDLVVERHVPWHGGEWRREGLNPLPQGAKFLSLRYGHYKLQAKSSDGGRYLSDEVICLLAPHSPLPTVKFTLVADLTLSLNLFTPEGIALPSSDLARIDIQVKEKAPPRISTISVRHQASGKFTGIYTLQEGLAYTVNIWETGTNALIYETEFVADATPKSLDITIPNRNPSQWMRVQVESLHGTGSDGLRVVRGYRRERQMADGSWSSSLEGENDRGIRREGPGVYFVPNVSMNNSTHRPSGHERYIHFVRAMHPSLGSASVEYTPDVSSTLVIRFQVPTSLEIQLRNASSLSSDDRKRILLIVQRSDTYLLRGARADSSTLCCTHLDKEGTLRLAGLQPGIYRVVLVYNAESDNVTIPTQAMEVELVGGIPKQVQLDPPSFGTLTLYGAETYGQMQFAPAGYGKLHEMAFALKLPKPGESRQLTRLPVGTYTNLIKGQPDLLIGVGGSVYQPLTPAEVRAQESR